MQVKSLPKVLLLFCGGTISSHKDEKTGSLKVEHGGGQLLQIEPGLATIAEISVRHVASIDSTDADVSLWTTLATIISEEYSQFDSFVITMGTNTMAYCSSALSFALQGIGKPVCITGAQIPAELHNSDARNNLFNAVRISALDIAGVYVVFGSRVIPGARAKKISESELDAFKSYNAKDLGEIGVGTYFHTSPPNRHSDPFKAQIHFDDSICCFTLIPGLSCKTVMSVIEGGVKGLIFRAYGSGDIPEVLIPALEAARSREIPVIATTQCPGGATIMGINDPGRKALELGVIEAFDMSMEAMSTKLMWLLGAKTKYADFKARMQSSLVGECNPQRSQTIRSTFAEQ